ncbi:hypothetical protein [Gorillibacterium sp. sgz5001074]|uniref:hypothetical protein n=1 Tax=Gorillibacterium sp. sgz5001074 TaxID=3446695 RepID=UPI003F668D11
MNRNRTIRPPIRYIWAAAAGAMLLVAGCGRTLPAIDAQTLSSKKSLLVVTAPSLSEEEEKSIRSAAVTLAKEQKLALEFVPDAQGDSEDLAARFRNPSIDSIIAVGNELVQPAAELAKDQTGKRVVLLGNGRSKPEISGPLPAHVLKRNLDESKKTTAWNDWVQLQRANGMNVLWVTRTSSPVPVVWAPSEETDRIVQRDIYPGDTWFPQLTYQAQALPAQWLALYVPLEEAELAKVKTLRIPIMDLSAGTVYTYHWDVIVRNAMAAALDQSWSGGELPYSDQELAVTRK